jgi:hypothetical protein
LRGTKQSPPISPEIASQKALAMTQAEQLPATTARAQDRPRRNPLYRRLIMFVVVLIGLAVFGLARLGAPLQTLTVTDSRATWIMSAYPEAVQLSALEAAWLTVDLHDGRGPFNPRLPFNAYPVALIDLSSDSVVDVLLRFQGAALPAGSRVEHAGLIVFFERSAADASLRYDPPVTIAAYRLLHDWEPATATFAFPWAEPGLRPGADYDPAVLDRQTLTAAGSLTFDVSAAFPAWQDGRNFGLVLMAVAAPAGHCPYVAITANHPDSTRWPQLVVQYR